MRARTIAYTFVVLAATMGVANADMGVPMLAISWPAAFLLLIPITMLEAVVLSRKLNLPWWPALRASALSNGVSTLVGIPVTWFLVLFYWGGGVGYVLVPLLAIVAWFRRDVRPTLRLILACTAGMIVAAVLGIGLTMAHMAQTVPRESFRHVLPRMLDAALSAPWMMPDADHPEDGDKFMPLAQIILLVPFFFGSWLIESRIIKRVLNAFSAGDIDSAVFKANQASYALLAALTASAFFWR